MNYKDEKRLQVAMRDVDDSLRMFDSTMKKLEDATKTYESINENIAKEVETLKAKSEFIGDRISANKKVIANFKKLLNY